MTYLLGLTGSIGMGKSTTAQMFRDEGVPVWDADAAVHTLYAKGGAAVPVFAEKLPQAVVDGAVDRSKLKQLLIDKPETITVIEGIVHPLVAQHRAEFLRDQSAPLVVMDIPLLYETGADDWLDAVLVVSAPEDVQRDRVLARGQMSEEMFEQILSRQISDAEKRRRADYVIETLSLDGTRAAVQELIGKLKGRLHA